MHDPFDRHSEEDEAWLRQHQEIFEGRGQEEAQPAKRKKRQSKRKQKRRALAPIKVSSGKFRRCNSCQQPSLVGTFRYKKCLGCQVAEYLGIL